MTGNRVLRQTGSLAGLVQNGTCLSLLWLAASFTLSAANQGTLVISGRVEPVEQIVVAPQASSSSLDLTRGEKDKLVATVTERSNAALGYNVTIRSANASTAGSVQPFLKGTAQGAGATAQTVPYTLRYNGEVVQLTSSGEAIITSASGKTKAAGALKNVQISLPSAWVAADTYNDTLIFTLANK